MLTVADFKPSQYASPDGSVRVFKLGVFWYGELRTPRGWEPLAEHCPTYEQAIARSLDELRTFVPEPDDDPPYAERDAPPF